MKGGVRAPRNPGGTWAYRIDLGSGPGRGRSQKQVAGFGSREEAEAALAEALAAQGGGDRKTVAGFLELVWLPAKQREVDRSTLDQYAWAVRRHIAQLKDIPTPIFTHQKFADSGVGLIGLRGNDKIAATLFAFAARPSSRRGSGPSSIRMN